MSILLDRFAIPEAVFDPYIIFKREKSWYLLRRSTHLYGASRLKISREGLRAFRKVSAFIKPTTRMIQIFGRHATKAVVEIDENALSRLEGNKTLPMELDLETGYVILSMKQNRILGLGFYASGLLRSQIPQKEWRQVKL